MARGRPPKPDAIKKLTGTLQKCRINKDQPIIAGDLSTIEPPAYLSESAKELWREALEMAPPDLLKTVDACVFETWVHHYALIRQLRKEIACEGLTVPTSDGGCKKNPKAALLLDLELIALRCCSEMGFTPASRSKVKITPKEAEHTETAISLISKRLKK